MGRINAKFVYIWFFLGGQHHGVRESVRTGGALKTWRSKERIYHKTRVVAVIDLLVEFGDEIGVSLGYHTTLFA
jgi:hypothetical protein